MIYPLLHVTRYDQLRTIGANSIAAVELDDVRNVVVVVIQVESQAKLQLKVKTVWYRSHIQCKWNFLFESD